MARSTLKMIPDAPLERIGRPHAFLQNSELRFEMLGAWAHREDLLERITDHSTYLNAKLNFCCSFWSLEHWGDYSHYLQKRLWLAEPAATYVRHPGDVLGAFNF